VFSFLAVFDFLVLSIFYLKKWAQHPEKVLFEFKHPILSNFFGTITISILLLSAVIGFYHKNLGAILWVLGAILTICLSIVIVSRVFQGKIDVSHIVPAWLIAGVATLDIAVTGGSMTFSWAYELNLLSLAIGSFVALLFFILISSRLIYYHEHLPTPAIPSLMILIAPFAVGFLGYTHVIRDIDLFASLLFYFASFLFFILSPKVFHPSVYFGPTWWAVSFPLAALTSAAIKYAQHAQFWFLSAWALFLIIFTSVVIIVLAIRTLTMLFRGDLLK
jgi:tellurite resistance protein